MNVFYTEQEAFWAGNFGNEYTLRNQQEGIIASNVALFSKILTHTHQIKSCLEFGANVGLNLLAIRQLLPNIELSALEINELAVKSLQLIQGVKVYHQSIFDFAPEHNYDFVLLKGVLIHLNPVKLPDAYDAIYKTSNSYICIAEYYNPTPAEVTYRGHKERLFKRDFAGEMLDRFKDLRLIEYGFAYHRDNYFPQDDINWFLLKKC